MERKKTLLIALFLLLSLVYSGYALPDFDMDFTDFLLNDSGRIEGERIRVNFTVDNIGDTDAFNVSVVLFHNGNFVGNTSVNVTAGGSNETNISIIGNVSNNTLKVAVDLEDAVAENIESNNNATTNFTISAYDTFFGVVQQRLRLGLGGSSLLDIGDNTGLRNIFITDSDSNVDFSQLKPLGINTSDLESNSDFTEADTALGMTTFEDNLVTVYTNMGVPKQIEEFLIAGTNFTNVSIRFNLGSLNFTGIMWDASDDTDGEYDATEKEDLIFVTSLNVSADPIVFDFEIQFPTLLRNYTGNINTVDIFLE